MSDLPVDPARLRRQFPQLTDDDIAAYEAVTRRILEQKGKAERGRVTREVMETARSARAKAGGGAALTDAERQALRYLEAVEKMQGGAAGPAGTH
jgi:hypothetical protein